MHQSTRPRYLTKSRFKLALECETKLFYTGKPEYADKKKTDTFLISLAEGGFQVGELAKLYYPDGVDITTLDYEESLAQTGELLMRDEVTIYEAAVRYKNLFIRADVLVKKGDVVHLLEVKAKSFSDDPKKSFLNSKGHIRSGWKAYLYDIAFQKHVMMRAFPQYRVHAHLLLADKNAVTSVDGLNQNFLLVRDGSGRSHVKVKKKLTSTELGNRILRDEQVDEIIESIFQGTDRKDPPAEGFDEWVDRLSVNYAEDRIIPCDIGAKCASCEFVADSSDTRLQSGFVECWLRETDLDRDSLREPLVTELWNSRKKGSYIEKGTFLLRDLEEDDIGIKEDEKPGLSGTERQWLQVSKVKHADQSEYFDIAGMKEQMDRWRYPLHFIDFETSMVAIPFNKGMAPYELIAFQFSHHTVSAKGKIVHADQYLCSERGVLPNFRFLRALKSSLEHDAGTIFRYAAHENSCLCTIYDQLDRSDEPDKKELMEWITTIAAPTKNGPHQWEPGPRNMVDMLELVHRFYYHPLMNGSNSIKKVLPAVLAESRYLQQRYAKPVYGSAEIPSFNFENWSWIVRDGDGVPKDPYLLLPKIFDDVDPEEIDNLLIDPELKEGGAAMTAFAKMQFSEMNDKERIRIGNALLRYCELDTFAMVLIWEYWNLIVSAA